MAKRNYAKREEKEYNWTVEAFQHIAVDIFVIPFMKLKYKVNVVGKENIPEDESFIMAPTHTNYFDPLLAYYATKRPVAFMAKKELFDIGWLCPLIVQLGAFSVNREKLEVATIKTSQMIIRTKKWILSLFPQGSRDKACQITRITPGFAYFARVAKAKVLPISIRLVETKKEKQDLIGKFLSIFDSTPILTKFLNSYYTYEIAIGKPFEYSKELADTMEKWCDAIVELGGYTVTDQVRKKIQKERTKEQRAEQHESANSES